MMLLLGLILGIAVAVLTESLTQEPYEARLTDSLELVNGALATGEVELHGNKLLRPNTEECYCLE